jgi:hypothetical protein
MMVVALAAWSAGCIRSHASQQQQHNISSYSKLCWTDTRQRTAASLVHNEAGECGSLRVELGLEKREAHTHTH